MAGYSLYPDRISTSEAAVSCCERYGMTDLSSTFERLHAELAASVLACRARPKKHAVHTLRTTSRRIEALLRKYLRDHPQSKALRESANEALRQVKKVRKAAGPVRDLDVHRKLVKTLAEDYQANSAAQHKDLGKERDHLDRVLRHRRKRSANNLSGVLKDVETKLERSLESVSQATQHLHESSPFESAKELFHGSSLDLSQVSGEELHRYRKQTKPARYLAEMQEASATAQRLAKTLKTMLDDIGRWHDLLLLAKESKSVLGRRSVLAEAIKAERDHAWEAAIDSVQTKAANVA